MTQRPQLDPADILPEPVNVDYAALLEPLLTQRTQSPIVRPSTAEQVSALIDTRFPEGGDSLEQVARQITEATARFPRRNTHPGFFGWVAPSGLPSDALANAMVSVLNENVGGYWASPVGTTVERTVIGWLAELSGFPASAEGVLLSGGSMANMTAIAVALARRYGADFRHRGLTGLGRSESPTVVCSRETHFSIRRAVAMLGLGIDNIVTIDTDDAFRMRPDRLAEILYQRDDVVCVVATAGTTNTGAIDPLEEIAELCARHAIWMHVDAAYGGGGLMSSDLRPRYRGIERADSVTMDLHKWFFQALDGSLLLYRDADPARELFSDSTDYLIQGQDDTPEQYAFFQIAPELSRRFRALPFYVATRCYGIARLGRLAWHNAECAAYLAALAEAHEDTELVAAPQLSILCFRYAPAGLPTAEIDQLNSDIRDRIQAEGDYLLSPTRVDGRPVLRACIINHATRVEHVEGLFASVLRIGAELRA
jgi:aromatic-L-amino-acid/L-tryptophan decarboxylase